MSKNKNIALTLGVIVAGLIGLHFYLQRRKKEREETVEALYDAIDNDRGLDGTVDIMSLLFREKPDVKYDATADAEKLWTAQGGFLAGDNADQVFEVLRGKTSGQLVVLNDELKRSYGKDLGQYIDYIFDMPWEADSNARAKTMIKGILT